MNLNEIDYFISESTKADNICCCQLRLSMLIYSRSNMLFKHYNKVLGFDRTCNIKLKFQKINHCRNKSDSYFFVIFHFSLSYTRTSNGVLRQSGAVAVASWAASQLAHSNSTTVGQAEIPTTK